jgi:hypothetical protein
MSNWMDTYLEDNIDVVPHLDAAMVASATCGQQTADSSDKSTGLMFVC